MSITLDEDGVWAANNLIIEDSNASLSFFGEVSGTIDAKNPGNNPNMMVSIICKAYSPESSCNGLVLDVPEYVEVDGQKKQRAFLECIDYGCTNITII